MYLYILEHENPLPPGYVIPTDGNYKTKGQLTVFESKLAPESIYQLLTETRCGIKIKCDYVRSKAQFPSDAVLNEWLAKRWVE